MMNEEEEPPLDEDDEEEEPALDEEDEGSFPFPPPPLPPRVRARVRGPRDMVFVARRTGPADRDHEDIMLRRVPRTVGHRFRGAAGARGLTHAQYLAALVNLHEAMRQRADQGDPEVAATLERLGLRTVSI